MSEPTVAIALYRPHPGKEDELLEIVKDHLPTLQRENLIKDRMPLHLQAIDGTILEIFEWKSVAAKDEAHQITCSHGFLGEIYDCCRNDQPFFT
ncbi:hypothetical protein [Guptibacillus algicola]|uniref:hypothetical protein n=1 Tax=Guptibacillus algicola TaxID=225844 RepID=UPI001CD1E9C6|nr:hypothetical protein [Alkalihalobacillus algicola]MCA0989284.1 hypothetical protein [Alkalihalobacillus algicola]